MKYHSELALRRVVGLPRGLVKAYPPTTAGAVERKGNMAVKKKRLSGGRTAGSRGAHGSVTPDDLEQACIDLLVGDFWCDAGLRDHRIYNILTQRKKMTTNKHGQMVEVSPNREVSNRP